MGFLSKIKRAAKKVGRAAKKAGRAAARVTSRKLIRRAIKHGMTVGAGALGGPTAAAIVHTVVK